LWAAELGLSGKLPMDLTAAPQRHIVKTLHSKNNTGFVSRVVLHGPSCL
jgi:hypothetical protein